MEISHIPPLAGVYCIRNKNTGKVYVGSSTRMRYRLANHRKTLRKGIHFSPVLSASWNKHGESAFECEVLELVSTHSTLRAREQHWMDTFKCIVPHGYNIAPNATSNVGLIHSAEWSEKTAAKKRRTFRGFISPSGEDTTIHCMRDFCREHGLLAEAMYMLAKGTISTHHGWTHANAKKSKRMVVGTFAGLIDPNGVKVGPVTDLRSFCRDRGLSRKRILYVIRGEKSSCKGWTCEGGKQRKPQANNGFISTTTGFIDPSGNPVTITNLAKFCRDNGLDERSMFRVKSGKFRSHRGWTFPTARIPILV